MVTRGTLSSTLTSKNGRSEPLDVVMPPSLFFIAAKLLLVAHRIACNHIKPMKIANYSIPMHAKTTCIAQHL